MEEGETVVGTYYLREEYIFNKKNYVRSIAFIFFERVNVFPKEVFGS